jgi:hypothetical protein
MIEAVAKGKPEREVMECKVVLQQVEAFKACRQHVSAILAT